nr:MFS transporter [Saccharopolyspora sp. HNM0983]
MINFADKAVLGLAAGPMMRELGMTASQYGAASSAFYAMFGVSAVVVGFIANSYSNRRIILIMVLVWGLAQVPIIFFASVVSVFMSRVVLGAAEGPANPIAVNSAQKWFPDDQRNLPTSLVNLGAALGVVTLAPILSLLIEAHGWRSAFVAVALLGLVWAVLWSAFGRDAPGVRPGQVPGSEGSVALDSHITRAAPPTGDRWISGIDRVPYRNIFFSGTGLSVLIAGFAVYWSIALLVSWIPLYLSGPMALDPAAAGALVVLPWVCGAVAIPAQGAVSDRLLQRGVSSRGARAGVSSGCILTAAVAIAGLTLVSATGVKLALLAIGFSVATVQISVGMTLIAEITPLRQRPAVLATTTAVTGVSGVVAPALAGRFVDAYGAGNATGYHVVFLLTAVLFLAGAVCLAVFARPVRDAARLARLGRAEHAAEPVD